MQFFDFLSHALLFCAGAGMVISFFCGVWVEVKTRFFTPEALRQDRAPVALSDIFWIVFGLALGGYIAYLSVFDWS